MIPFDVTNVEHQNLVTNFRDQTLGDGAPDGMCFTLTYPLSLYLENKGISIVIIPGKVQDTSHFWLSPSTESEFIIDPTITQFVKIFPTTFFGSLPSTHTIKQKKGWFLETFRSWLNPDFTENHSAADRIRLIEGKVILSLKCCQILLESQNDPKLTYSSNIIYLHGVLRMFNRLNKIVEWSDESKSVAILLKSALPF